MKGGGGPVSASPAVRPDSGGYREQPSLVPRDSGAPPPRARTAARNVYAALDLGTNNCRLLVATPTWTSFRVIDAFSRLVRLGEGLGAGNRLHDDAIHRTIDALRICGAKMRQRGVTRARLIATQACRAAANGADFVVLARQETGLDLEIVDQRTEAMLAAGGCAALADPQAEGVVLFDIGGGSSEIVWLDRRRHSSGDVSRRVRAWSSLPLGVVTLAERYGGHDVTRETFEAMVEAVQDALAEFRRQVSAERRCDRFHLLGTSGTVTTLAGIHLGLRRYDRRRVDGLWMELDDVVAVMEGLLGLPFEARAANPCVGPERADLVLAGCAIFEGIRRSFPCPRLRIADRGLREGILIQLMNEDGAWRQGRGRP